MSTEEILAGLAPDVQDMARKHLQACARIGILLKLTQGYRDSEAQSMLYAQGRTAPGQIVTHAPPGYSWHEFRRAYDIAQQGAQPYPDDDTFWDTVGLAGESVGLEWGGRWKHPDRPHFQHTGGWTLAAAREKAIDGHLA